MAQDGALCPFFTLRSGVEFQYASLRPHLPASTGALAHSPSYAASNSGNEYPALECVYDNRPGEFSLSQSAVAPFDTFFLGGACHTEETYAEGGQQTYQDARIFPPQYPIPRMADSNTPADSVCRFMSEHGLLPPGAAETIRPLIHHILQPAVLIDIQQGSVSVVNAINALSIEHDLVPENQHINLNEGMNALNHCGTLMQQNQVCNRQSYAVPLQTSLPVQTRSHRKMRGFRLMNHWTPSWLPWILVNKLAYTTFDELLGL